MSRNKRRRAESMPYRMEIHVISARKLDIRREIAGSLKNGKRRTPIRKPWEIPVVLLPAQQFHVTIVGKRVISHGSAEENGEIKEGEVMADMEADRWRKWPNPWQLCKKFWRNWYQKQFFPREFR